MNKFFKDKYSSFFSFFLNALSISILIRLYFFFFLYWKKNELQNTSNIIDIGKAISLKNYLKFLEIGSKYLLLLFIAFFLLYSFIHLNKLLLIKEKELQIKSILGATPFQIGREFFLRESLINLIGYSTGVLLVAVIYDIVYRYARSWIQELLVTPLNFIIFYDSASIFLLIIWVLLLFIYCLFFIRKRYYTIK